MQQTPAPALETRRRFFSRLLGTQRRRILVVDDDEDLQTVFLRVARSLDPGLVVDWTSDLATARSWLRSRSYDLVLVDYLLPGHATGLALRPTCLRRQPRAAFAVMSVLPVDEYLRSAGQQACLFLSKPFSLEECGQFLRSALTGGGH